jgi:hypothetical protein
MYTSLITTHAVRPIDPRPFKATETLKVLSEKKYSFLVWNKYDAYYQVERKSHKTHLHSLAGYYEFQ